MNIYPAYISKYNLNHENRIILIQIPNREGCYYLAVKKIICIIERRNQNMMVISFV